MTSLVGSDIDVEIHPDESSSGILTPQRRIPSAEDLHPSTSPKRAAEELFLGHDLDTQQISASLLAQQIHQTHRAFSFGRSRPSSSTTVRTDDFHSVEQADESLFPPSIHTSLSTDLDSAPPLGNITATTTDFHDSKMSSTEGVDPAEKVYDAAKGVWSWGKGVMVLSPFLGLAEGVAGKVVEMAGSSLEETDDVISSQLHGLDEKYLNPAIAAVVSTVVSILKPVGLIKDDPSTGPDMTSSQAPTKITYN